MTIPKIIALYLPQFYETPENNKWWGKGFTEWTSVKKSYPLFNGHDQPKIPYNENYYKLNKNTLELQAGLAKEYGVHGFCFYHYWFLGKKILNKPAEILLENKNIDINFCFSWANQTWSRTWYGYNKEILIEQKYGSKEDWRKHFQYLVNFFKDNRYIKIEGKPLLVIYQPKDIKKYEQMIKFWKELAVYSGFKGLYIVETLSTKNNIYSSESDAAFYYEPGYTFNTDLFLKNKIKIKSFIMKYLFKNRFLLNIFEYNKVYTKILKRKINFSHKNFFLGCFVNWDNTARKNNLAYIFKGFSILNFKDNLYKVLLKAQKNNSKFIFITAWNEWAEGSYLEPDAKNEFKYLECIKESLLKLKDKDSD